jgi:pimeloyl-ACP methyl ester carboxylesterase
VLVAALIFSGCMLARARKDQKQIAALGRIHGSVETEHASENPLMVVLLPASTMDASTPDDLEIVDHFVRERAGDYVFVVAPGTYLLAAFEDTNADGNYDPDEPLLSALEIGPDGEEHYKTFDVAAGQTQKFDLTITTQGRAATRVDAPIDIAGVQARSFKGQAWTSLGQLLTKGAVADLSDERFGPASGRLGLWEPLNAAIRVGGGIFFTEPYDPNRIPVLFVHGISGYPQEFREIIDALDRDTFQAWFYFYPSGIRLEGLARWGAETMRELQIRHGFDEFAVVAHSMGGLVSRSLILQHAILSERSDALLFLSISTPWGGHQSAEKGVKRSPVIVESWIDIAPSSDFLKNLFWREGDPDAPETLPDQTAFHMLWGFGGPNNNTDGVVSIASQQRAEAQDQASSNRGFAEDHTGILKSDDVKTRINAILAARFD